MFKIKTKLKRNEKRLLSRINSKKSYKIILLLLFSIFSFKKTFLIASKSMKRISWIISVTVYKIFWKKISYIDDFIVHKKSRWKWIWKRMMLSVMQKLKNENNDYAFLISWKKRKISHRIYKNLWFKIIWLWIGILAYKKFKKKK
jgi:hypothetical protein